MSIFTLWQLDDLIWDRIVSDPASSGDRGALDFRKLLRSDDPTETDVAVYWFNREFRDNPPTTYPMIILTALGPGFSTGIRTRANQIKFVFPDGRVLFREAPEFYDFTYQVSVYDDIGRRFEEVAYDIQRNVFEEKAGARFIDIDPPNRVNRGIELTNISSSAFRSESAYRRDFTFAIRRLALFAPLGDAESLKEETILSWMANIAFTNDGGVVEQTEVVVRNFP